MDKTIKQFCVNDIKLFCFRWKRNKWGIELSVITESRIPDITNVGKNRVSMVIGLNYGYFLMRNGIIYVTP